jgi:hypothetical protein
LKGSNSAPVRNINLSEKYEKIGGLSILTRLNTTQGWCQTYRLRTHALRSAKAALVSQRSKSLCADNIYRVQPNFKLPSDTSVSDVDYALEISAELKSDVFSIGK